MTRARFASFMTTIFLLLWASTTRAQDATGKIVGTVFDPTGGAVAGATVRVTNVANQASKVAVTDTSSFYQILQLPVGDYRVTAEAPGFSKIVSEGKNALDINQTLRIDLKLQIGQVTDTVSVSSEAPGVETQNSTVGGTVTGRAIFELL